MFDDAEIGDVFESKHGNLFVYQYSPYLERFMLHRIGLPDTPWWELTEVVIINKHNNIFTDGNVIIR